MPAVPQILPCCSSSIRVLAQIIRQPTNRRNVKVVRRLIQQKQIRLRKNRTGEHRLADLSARKRRDRTGKVLLRKPESQERRTRQRTERRASFARKGIHDRRLSFDQAVPVCIVLFEPFQNARFLGFQIQQRPVCFERKRIEVCIAVELRNLFHIGQLRSLPHAERPAVVRFLSHQDSHQRRFAASVYADQTDALSRTDLKGHVRKQRSVRKCLFQVFYS